ncbi:MAG TPA: DUF3592 domain-containing protein [Trebonia sp.]
MAVFIGVWMALAGALALLAGASARRRVRRLKRDGIKVWAEAIHRPPPDGEQHDGRQYDSSQQVTLQYTLTDGRVLERSARTRRGAPLASGEKVLIWYDPDDPAEVVISGRDGRASDLAFVVIGLIFLLAGAGIAIGG